MDNFLQTRKKKVKNVDKKRHLKPQQRRFKSYPFIHNVYNYNKELSTLEPSI